MVCFKLLFVPKNYRYKLSILVVSSCFRLFLFVLIFLVSLVDLECLRWFSVASYLVSIWFGSCSFSKLLRWFSVALVSYCFCVFTPVYVFLRVFARFIKFFRLHWVVRVRYGDGSECCKFQVVFMCVRMFQFVLGR